MDIKDLSKAGSRFRATAGAGNFKRKLEMATRHHRGELGNLGDNQEAIKSIENVAENYKRAIRRGEFSRLRRKAAFREIKKADETLTKGDKRDIKKILIHLGSVSKSKESVKTNQGPTEEQEERNIKRSIAERRTAVDGRTARVSGHGFFAGGKVGTRSMETFDRDEIRKVPSRFGLSGPSFPNSGMANPPAPGIGGLGPRRFL